MDAVFGRDNFRSELIWKRTTVSKTQSKSIGKVHDTILHYSKSDTFTFNKEYEKYSEEYMKKSYKGKI